MAVVRAPAKRNSPCAASLLPQLLLRSHAHREGLPSLREWLLHSPTSQVLAPPSDAPQAGWHARRRSVTPRSAPPPGCRVPPAPFETRMVHSSTGRQPGDSVARSPIASDHLLTELYCGALAIYPDRWSHARLFGIRCEHQYA